MNIDSVSNRRWLVVAGIAALLLVSVTFGRRDAGAQIGQSDPCAAKSDYPFTSVSCQLLKQQGTLAQVADARARSAISITEDQASAIALRLNPGATLLETRLVYIWSPDDPNPQAHRQLRWAVSLKLPNGIYISGGAYYLRELKKLRPDLNIKDRPLTAAEVDAVGNAVEASIQAQRSKFVEEYHIDYIDAQSGQWVSAAEGSR